MTTPLTVTPVPRPDGSTDLSLTGEIDMTNTRLLAAALNAHPGPLRLDLTGITYLDSAGLSLLFTHAARLELTVTPLLEPAVTLSGLSLMAAVRTVHTRP